MRCPFSPPPYQSKSAPQAQLLLDAPLGSQLRSASELPLLRSLWFTRVFPRSRPLSNTGAGWPAKQMTSIGDRVELSPKILSTAWIVGHFPCPSSQSAVLSTGTSGLLASLGLFFLPLLETSEKPPFPGPTSLGEARSDLGGLWW